MPEYEIKPQQDERNAQHLPHVDRHGVLELYLTFFEKLDKETESEYQGDAKPEIEAFADSVFPLPVYPDHDAEEQEIGKRFVKLSRMPGLEVDLLEDKCPRQCGRHCSKTNAQGNVVGIPMISEFIRLARRMKPAATGAAMPNISSTSK